MQYDALGYYQLLGLSPQAGDEQIKQAYRDLAKFWHPDHNKDEQALEKFQKLSVAYDVLKETDSRLRYDLLSMVYGASDYPEYENIIPFQDREKDANVRAFILDEVRGKIWKYTQKRTRKILSLSNAPKVLDKTYQLKCHKNLFIAGQLSGVEGYIESTMSGLMAGINAYLMINDKNLISFSSNTMIGAITNYITNNISKNFQPMNANFGILNSLDYVEKNDKIKKEKLVERSIHEINGILGMI